MGPEADVGCNLYASFIRFNPRRLKAQQRDELPRNGTRCLRGIFLTMKLLYYRYAYSVTCVQVVWGGNQWLAQRTATARLRRTSASSSARRSIPGHDGRGQPQQPAAGRRQLAHGIHRAQFDGSWQRQWGLLRPGPHRLWALRRSPCRQRSPSVDTNVRLWRSVEFMDRSEISHRVHLQGKIQFLSIRLEWRIQNFIMGADGRGAKGVEGWGLGMVPPSPEKNWIFKAYETNWSDQWGAPPAPLNPPLSAYI